MEGPSLRAFPRTSFKCPVEVCGGGKVLRLKAAQGNLSVQGMSLNAEGFAENIPVRVKINCARPLELEGVVRYCDGNRLGIEFNALSKAEREHLHDLIAEFMPKEVLAA